MNDELRKSIATVVTIALQFVISVRFMTLNRDPSTDNYGKNLKKTLTMQWLLFIFFALALCRN